MELLFALRLLHKSKSSYVENYTKALEGLFLKQIQKKRLAHLSTILPN